MMSPLYDPPADLSDADGAATAFWKARDNFTAIEA